VPVLQAIQGRDTKARGGYQGVCPKLWSDGAEAGKLRLGVERVERETQLLTSKYPGLFSVFALTFPNPNMR